MPFKSNDLSIEMKFCPVSGMRKSNIELLRIVAMFLIVAHHYVVNSTVCELFDPVNPTVNSLFLQIWGMWGKTGINVFVLITGYFMCKSHLTTKRYAKLLFEIVFYAWVMWFLLCATGYEIFSLRSTVKQLCLIKILKNQNSGFMSAFMWMYLLIPAMNVYLNSASRRNLYFMLGILLAMFTFCGTLFQANVYHHVFWYCTLYFAGGAIKIYPFKWMENNNFCVPLLIFSIITGMLSVAGIVLINAGLGSFALSPYYFVADSHKILAFFAAFFAFLVFKNMKMAQSRFVNTVASTTFGVLLIHAATNGMMRLLWQDLFDVRSAVSFSFPALVGYSIAVVAGVFISCSVLDYLRIRFIERPLFSKMFSSR